MSLANFFEPKQVGTMYTPRMAQIIAEGQKNRRSMANMSTSKKVFLLLIDVQVDFVHEDGALSVPGAIDDTRRLVPWMIDRTEDGTLTSIGASLDSHVPVQIFSPIWWMDQNGNSPEPFTVISMESIENGSWRPRVSSDGTEDLVQWSLDYVEALETQSRKQLMIWPYHCLIGTPGQTLVPAVAEGIAYHTGARGNQPVILSKGGIAKTEFYSILEPEIHVPNHPQGGLNTDFLDTLAAHDLIYIAGQAKSHCVLETIESIMRRFKNHPEVIRRIRFLMDCTSSVVHPAIDFEAIANKRFAEFERMGAKLVTTQTWDR